MENKGVSKKKKEEVPPKNMHSKSVEFSKRARPRKIICKTLNIIDTSRCRKNES